MIELKYKAAAVALTAVVVVSLAVLTHSYKKQVETLTDSLQDVTTQLTEQREQHDSFIRQQGLIRDIVAAGRVAKQADKEEVEHVLKERGVHKPVVPEPDDAERLHSYSNSVRERASNRPY